MGCVGFGPSALLRPNGAPLFLFLQEKYRLAGLPELPFAKRPRARGANGAGSSRGDFWILGPENRREQEGEDGSAAIFGTSGLGPNESRIWVHETFWSRDQPHQDRLERNTQTSRPMAHLPRAKGPINAARPVSVRTGPSPVPGFSHSSSPLRCNRPFIGPTSEPRDPTHKRHFPTAPKKHPLRSDMFSRRLRFTGIEAGRPACHASPAAMRRPDSNSSRCSVLRR